MKSSSKKQPSRSRKQSPSSSRSGQMEQSGSRSSGKQQVAASGAGGQYGEGNYEATRQYNSGLKRHLETSDVEQEARDAAPRSSAEEKEMNEAERVARGRARGGDSVEAIDEGADTDEDLQK